MRKHDVRKWLHAILDLLPVILIPVFMIYSHRHIIDSGSIQVPQNKVVEFNQYVENSHINDDFTFEPPYINYYSANGFPSNDSYIFRMYINSFNDIGNWSVNVYDVVSGNNFDGRSVSVSNGLLSIAFQSNTTYQSIGFGFYFDTTDGGTINYSNFNIFNLTQMFGIGNEPTLQRFNELYPNEYYEYTSSHIELLKNYSTITFDDTDIMSQATYQLYNAVDKYFNVGNVFHLGEIYDWFNLNIFNGNAPIYIYVVYQIVLYELIMDLLFLLYALFMWFIDMIEKLMEKPLNSVR